MAAVLAHEQQVRGPKGHLVLGHGPDFARDQLGYLPRLARDYGDFVRLRLAVLPAAFVNHPDLVEEVLVTHNRHFVKSLAVRRLSAVVGNGLLTSEGDFWRRQRRLAQPAFHRARIAAYGAVMASYAERMAAGWRNGDERDVHHEMMRLTLEVVGKTLFDAEVGTSEAEEVGEALTEALESISARVKSIWIFLPNSVPAPGTARVKHAVRRLDQVVYRIIQQRRASGEDRGDLLSLLLHAQDEDDGGRMTDRQLRDEVMTLFLAGHETTALVLSWAWYLLGLHPEAEARLQAELDAVLGGRTPSVADVPRLAYTGMVVSEVLRLYPPAWAIGRQAIRDTQLGEHRLRKGSIVIVSPWVMHRDGRFFAEPEAFRPERWADGLAKRLPRFAYFPFGGGPRQCIGSQFAIMEAILILATLAQRFRLELLPGQQIVPEPTITLRPKHGIRVRLHARAAAAPA